MIDRLSRLAQDCANGIEDKIGKKAYSLLELMRLGVPVPDGFCVFASALDDHLDALDLLGIYERLETADDEAVAGILGDARERIRKGEISGKLASQIETALRDFEGRAFAVRSSGTKEDLQGASFAGQYTTVLNVKGIDAVIGAVKVCWASLFDRRVYEYCKTKGIPFRDVRMSVVVQELIDATRSGVVFTVDPTTGDDTHMLVEACFGLGEALVGGEVTPDSAVYDWYEGRKISGRVSLKKISIIPSANGQTEKVELDEDASRRPVLGDDELAELCKTALRIQSGYGYPVDIEWVADSEGFYIVQARPITSIQLSGIQGQWTTADFKDGGVSSGVCSPMMWSLYDFIWERAMPGYLRQTKLLDGGEDIVWGEMFFGRPYWNAGAVKDCAARVPGFVERHFDEDLGIQVGYKGRGRVTRFTPATALRGLKVLSALRESFDSRMRHNETHVAWARGRMEELSRIDINAMNDGELFSLYEELIREDYWRVESSYFMHIYDNSNIQTLFKESLQKLAPKADFLNLVIGLENLSHMRPNYELWSISRKILADRSSAAFWETASTEEIVRCIQEEPGRSELMGLAEYIEKYGYHSTRELDITVSNYAEDSSFCIESLKRLLKLDDGHDPRALNEKQVALFDREKAALIERLPKRKQRKMSDSLTQMRRFLWWREELRDYSTQMYHQLRRFSLAVAHRLMTRRVLDSPDDVFFLTVDDLIALLRKEMTVSDARKRIGCNRLYYDSFRHYGNPPDIGFDTAGERVEEAANAFRGIPCSGGVVEGVAKVIRDIDDTTRLEKGDILVTRFTDPGWTPVFGTISGVVTQTGGVLSHAAVIAREYGIPAVLAVDEITLKLRDGQRVRLDGSRGHVTII